MTNKKQSNSFTRSILIDNTSIKNDVERIIEVSFSSEFPYNRGGLFEEEWVEILGHTEKEANLERLNSKAPILYNHMRFDRDSRIGVVERAWLERGKGRALIKISKRKDVDGIWQDIKDGILSNVSVGYTINKKELIGRNADGINEYRVTSWTPTEISMVDIPADYSVGVGRSEPLINDNLINKEKESNMDKNQNPNPNEAKDGEQNPNAETLKNRSLGVDIPKKEKTPINHNQPISEEVIRADLIKKENTRRDEIKKIFEPFMENHRELFDTCMQDMNMTPQQSRINLLNEIGKSKEPLNAQAGLNSDIGHGIISTGKTQSEKFRVHAEEAIEFRMGLKTAEQTKGNDLRGCSLLELARISLENAGVNTRSLDKREIVGRAFTHSTSDFPLILSNSANKALLKGYEETEEIFEKFTTKTSLNDFKTYERYGTSGFGSLDKVKEGGKYKYGTMTERKEDIRLETFGKMFSITRQAIINDDLNAFSDIPRKMGRAAKRTVANHVFAILTDGQVMSDGYQLFHAAKHNNLFTGAGSAGEPSIELISKMKAEMRKYKDPVSKEPLNIKPMFIVVPVALEDKVKILMSCDTELGQANPKVPNPIKGLLEVLSDPRLDDASTTAWYLLANPAIHDMLEVAYLDGNSNPLLEEQAGWDVDGIEYKVRLDFGVKAIDWKTMSKNDGTV